MSTFLWDSIAFGPIHSRRLGQSLGINLLPNDVKICSFDCLYCECGWTLEKRLDALSYPAATLVLQAIKQKLVACQKEHTAIDSITFSGNGEPTLHPEFPEIIDGLLHLRNQFYPQAAITVLSNATQLSKPAIATALKRIDNPILKLDAGNQSMLNLVNNPTYPIDFTTLVEDLCAFDGNIIIQTLFFRGTHEGVAFDNSMEPNLSDWLETLQKIKPKNVMIYSLDRDTPAAQLQACSKAELESIALKVQAQGLNVAIY